MPELTDAPALLTELVRAGFVRAESHLSDLLGFRLALTCPMLEFVSLQRGTHLFGDEAQEVIAVHTAFSGDIDGQVLLLLEREPALCLARACLMTQSPDPALAASLLSEVGNLASSAVLNTAADRLHLTVTISPPQVLEDLAGAVLGSVLPLVECVPDRVLIVRTAFGSADAAVCGLFLFLPDGPTLAHLVALLSGGPRA